MPNHRVLAVKGSTPAQSWADAFEIGQTLITLSTNTHGFNSGMQQWSESTNLHATKLVNFFFIKNDDKHKFSLFYI